MAGQDFTARDEGDADCGLARDLAQPMIDRQRQFHAARTAADHDDAQRAVPVFHALDESEPAPAQLRDGLHRCRVLGGARDGVETGRRADVEDEQVVGNRRPVLQQHPAVGPVETDGLGLDQARAGPGRQPGEIDVTVVEGVMAGDEARDHAGVGRLDVPADQGQAHAGHRLHAEAFQDVDMGMAAANQHEVLEEGRSLHPDSYNRSGIPLVQR